jgi:quercetin dioxygenase-like cupin family protein
MPSIIRPLADEGLCFDLEEEAARLERAGSLSRSGRSARTLVKDGVMRVVLTVLGAGGRVARHAVAGPVLVQGLRGEILVQVGEESLAVRAGELCSIGPAVEHSVESPAGGAFLLVVTGEDR